MTKKIMCKKLGEELDGLSRPPFPGELGARIFEQISQKAWGAWLSHQTMLINEYRLNLLESKSREFLMTEAEKFLFGTGSEKPDGFVAVEENDNK
jgi:Fe-S cluster biosynthesis and repair protein YggX